MPSNTPLIRTARIYKYTYIYYSIIVGKSESFISPLPVSIITAESKGIIRVVAASIPVEGVATMEHDIIVDGFFYVKSNAIIVFIIARWRYVESVGETVAGA